MNTLSIDQFEAFFESLYCYSPFPWQSMLLRRVASDGWPDLIDLPTAHGKTACIDIGVFSMALGLRTPRRIWFVVDRRIVVDEAHARALKIAQALQSADSGVLGQVASALKSLGGYAPLQVDRLRGGVPRSIAWAGNPAQPAVITSTVDQIGSKLLFRGYGVSDAAKPVHAALAGNDSLILLDEAHLAKPFFQTVTAVQRFHLKPWASEPLATPFKLVIMSATPPTDEDDRVWSKFPRAEERLDAITHPTLDERRAVRKSTELAVARRPKLPKEFKSPVDDELVLDAADRAAKLATAGRKRIAVMVNRVRTAREIAAVLKQLPLPAGTEVVLLTGRLRPIDRDELIRRYEPKLKAGSALDLVSPIIVVTTQCLEVGADFSFDVLITECASLDALRQRFGRLARLGTPADAAGVILIRNADVTPDGDLTDAGPADPIYGNALARTWNWLAAGGATTIEMGIDALEPRLPQNLCPYRAPQLDAPILLPAYLDLLSQTSPRPAIDPDVALFLHGIPPAGERPIPQVRVVWRDELHEAAGAGNDVWWELVAGLPPLTSEMLSMPIWECRSLLTGEPDQTRDDADLEGGFEPSDRGTKTVGRSNAIPRFVIWRGARNCEVSTNPDDLRPDVTIVLPASPEAPGFQAMVPYEWARLDVYEPAYRVAHEVIRKRWRRPDRDSEIDDEAIITALTGTVLSEERGLFRRPQPAQYAEGFFHFTGRIARRPVDQWESDADEDDLLYDGSDTGPDGKSSWSLNSRSLEGHTRDVVTAVAHLADRLGHLIPSTFDPLFREAAELHDLGKADPRFQYILSHGRRVDPARLRAKSDFRLSPAQEQQLYTMSHLPEGFRHELLSMMLALAEPTHRDPGIRDLLLHLIASHHGRCRPFAPVVEDAGPPNVAVGGRAITVAERKAVPPHRLASNVGERFWSLTRRYGWWGLAYLESILRCADAHASAYRDQEPHR